MDPAIVVFGFGIGLLVGMTGMGGASLMTPLLILVFGISPVTAIGTDIFYAAITKTVGGFKHLQPEDGPPRDRLLDGGGSVPSAIAGVWVIELLQASYGDDLDKLVLGMLGGALLVVGRRDAAALDLLQGRDRGALVDAPLPPAHHRRDRHRRHHAAS